MSFFQFIVCCVCVCHLHIKVLNLVTYYYCYYYVKFAIKRLTSSSVVCVQRRVMVETAGWWWTTVRNVCIISLRTSVRPGRTGCLHTGLVAVDWSLGRCSAADISTTLSPTSVLIPSTSSDTRQSIWERS